MSDRSRTAARAGFTLERRLKASPPAVFAAWTDPGQVVQWWGPAGAEVVLAEVDARIGGRFHKITRAPNGEENDVSGVFQEVVANRKLVFTWAWKSTPDRPSLVTVTVEPDAGGTLLTLTHENLFDEAASDSHRRGWTGALEKLRNFFP